MAAYTCIIDDCQRERGRDDRLQWIDSDRLIEKVSFRVKELGILLLATGKDLLAYVLV